ncbi:hypothetical protein PFLUV_G00247820 [Perca fluviatilis]|uniref:Uncharacterized protein n=1 Tax=Perca fluviatilis TaxID=8168 RepID=A0A6A5E7L1_PERFL|nr:hypothetical protein PFLUV_G00247820 [Perca fluviatilis]
MWHRNHFLLVTEAMGAIWAFVICVLTVWITKGLCLPVGGTNERRDNGLQRRMIGDLSPNDISMKKAFALLQSMESMLTQSAKEVQLETNEVEAEASFSYLNESKKLKTEKLLYPHTNLTDNLTSSNNLTNNLEANPTDNATFSDETSSDNLAGNTTCSDNLAANMMSCANLTTSDNLTSAKK